MIAFFKNRLNREAVRITVGCFLIGSALFLGCLSFPYDSLFGLGTAFAVVFTIIHLILLPSLFLNAMINYKDFVENLMACIITSTNVALAVLYLNLI